MNAAKKSSTQRSNQVVLTDKHHAMIAKYARQLHRRSSGRQSLADIKQAGYLALCESARKHDPSKGSLETFAYMRVRGAMMDEAVRCDGHKSYRQMLHNNGPVVDGKNNFLVENATGGGTSQATKESDAALRTSNGHMVHESLAAAPASMSDIDMRRLVGKVALSPIEQGILQKVFLDGKLMADAARELGISRFHASRVRTAMMRRLQAELGSKS